MNNFANINIDSLSTLAITIVTDWGLKIIAAVAVWFIGRWLIKLASQVFERILKSSEKIDKTLVMYLSSVVSWLLTIILILGVMGIFGVQTTSFAAILAGAGLAVGTAWGGLLTHFAAGIFLQMIRPFRVGDTISAAGITGKVANIGIFSTTIVAGGNIQTIIPNNKILSDNIQNFSALPYRRVDCNITLPYFIDLEKTSKQLKDLFTHLPNVRKDPEPYVTVSEFTPNGISLTVSGFTAGSNYYQVLGDGNRAIAQLISSIGTPRNELHVVSTSTPRVDATIQS